MNLRSNRTHLLQDAQILMSQILPRVGFECIAFTRLPYLSTGDMAESYTALDNLVLVARRIKK